MQFLKCQKKEKAHKPSLVGNRELVNIFKIRHDKHFSYLSHNLVINAER